LVTGWWVCLCGLSGLFAALLVKEAVGAPV